MLMLMSVLYVFADFAFPGLDEGGVNVRRVLRDASGV